VIYGWRRPKSRPNSAPCAGERAARQEKVIGKVRELEKLASVAELMNDLAEGKTA
jgi:hypothetical protein